jgi:hypothetical protein
MSRGVVLKDIVIEHVFGGLAEVDDPFPERRRLDAIRHVLGIDGTGGMVVAANPADPAGDEMRVAGILVLQEDRIAPKDGRGAMALDDFLWAKSILV